MIVTTRSLSSPTGRTRPFSAHNPHSVAGNTLLAALLGLFLVVPGKPATAASFDCGKAELPLDKLICQTPELSAKDDAMAAKYKAALAILSPEGQGILREGQRKWLKFVRTYCASRIGQPTDSHGGGDAMQCLASEYDTRLGQLDSAAMKVGEVVLSRVDDFQLLPSPAGLEDGRRGHFGYCIIGYPRIDASTSPEAKRRNEDWSQWAGTCAKQGQDEATNADLDLTFDVQLAQQNFIAISGSASGYFHGAGQAYISRGAWWNIVLPTLRKLTADDLFGSGSGGQQLIITRCLAALSRSLPVDRQPPDLSWSDVCLDSDNWSIAKEKLTVVVDLSADYLGVAFDDIPWKELRPFLAPDAPIKVPDN